MKKPYIYTFGHSTLNQESAIKILKDAGVMHLIDCRSHPQSRHVQWNLEVEQEWLPRAGISVSWCSGLGGWSHEDKAAAEEMDKYGVNVRPYCGPLFPHAHIARDREGAVPGTWTNQGLYDFQFFMTQRRCLDALERVIIEAAAGEACALMCSELLWWRCHRSMIADLILWRRIHTEAVRRPLAWHLQPRLTEHGLKMQERLDRYHPAVTAAWKEYYGQFH